MNGKDVTQGPWAGHCFDIVPYEVLEREKAVGDANDGAWKDVSEEVFRDLDIIFGCFRMDDGCDNARESFVQWREQCTEDRAKTSFPRKMSPIDEEPWCREGIDEFGHRVEIDRATFDKKRRTRKAKQDYTH